MASNPRVRLFVISRNDWIVGKINHIWMITKWKTDFTTERTVYGMRSKEIIICLV